MTSPSHRPPPEKKSLWVALACAFLLVAAATYGLGLLVDHWVTDMDSLRTGLSNVAAVGGIAGGLSLSTTAVLTLSGKFGQELVANYGSWIRGLIFGGYVSVVLVSIACAAVAMVPQWWLAPWVLSLTASFDAVSLIGTGLLINSGYKYRELDELLERSGSGRVIQGPTS